MKVLIRECARSIAGMVMATLRAILSVASKLVNRAPTGTGQPGGTRNTIVLLIPQMKHGGAERAVSRLIPLLDGEYNIRVLTFQRSEHEYAVACPVDSLDIAPDSTSPPYRKVLNVFRRVMQLNQYKRLHNVGAVYSFGDSANIASVLSSGGIRITSIRGHARVQHSSLSAYGLILANTSRASHAIVCVSNVIARSLIEKFGVPERKVKVIYNGYDPQTWFHGARSALNIERPSIVSMGTYRTAKGYWHLIKAVRLLREEFPGISLTIFGHDYQGHRGQLETLARTLGVADNVQLRGFEARPFEQLRKYDMYVLTSISEGFPNALVEALGCGLAAIATDCKSGPREILAPGTAPTAPISEIEYAEYGVLVPPFATTQPDSLEVMERGDELLASAISRLIRDNKLREAYEVAGTDRVQDFSYSRWKDSHVGLFAEIGVERGERQT